MRVCDEVSSCLSFLTYYLSQLLSTLDDHYVLCIYDQSTFIYVYIYIYKEHGS